MKRFVHHNLRSIIYAIIGLFAFATVGTAYVQVVGLGGSSQVVVTNGSKLAGSGGFTFLSVAASRSYYLSSGGTTQTSVPCTQVLLNLAGSGMVTTTGGTFNLNGGTQGLIFQTTGTNSFITAPLTLSASNLNSIVITGTGQVGYLYNN